MVVVEALAAVLVVNMVEDMEEAADTVVVQAMVPGESMVVGTVVGAEPVVVLAMVQVASAVVGVVVMVLEVNMEEDMGAAGALAMVLEESMAVVTEAAAAMVVGMVGTCTLERNRMTWEKLVATKYCVMSFL